MQMIGKLAFASMLGVAMGCSLILDFDLDVECWCGEQWTVQISGAHALGGIQQYPIPASKTTYVTCVSQLEHIALDTADPQNPVYVALRDNLESGAIANCEAAGALAVPFYFSGTNCATTGLDPVSTNFLHTGACWESKKYDLDAEVCPIEPECRPYYDCSNDPIVGLGEGNDEAGDGGVAWECDDPLGFAEIDRDSE